MSLHPTLVVNCALQCKSQRDDSMCGLPPSHRMNAPCAAATQGQSQTRWQSWSVACRCVQWARAPPAAPQSTTTSRMSRQPLIKSLKVRPPLKTASQGRGISIARMGRTCVKQVVCPEVRESGSIGCSNSNRLHYQSDRDIHISLCVAWAATHSQSCITRPSRQMTPRETCR